jgi:hypothetical protein
MGIFQEVEGSSWHADNTRLLLIDGEPDSLHHLRHRVQGGIPLARPANTDTRRAHRSAP